MNESILKAMMRLFAIIANVNKDGVSTEGRAIVHSYLELHLNQDSIPEYLNLFDDYVKVHHHEVTKKDGTKTWKRTSANSVKVLMICRQVNEELQQEQKMLVLLQLLEFINENKHISEQELDFVDTVANVFNIEDEEYRNIKAFVINTVEHIPQKENVMIVDSDKEGFDIGIKHICNAPLDGEIIMLRIASTNMYAFRYKGSLDIYLNGHNILPHRTYILDKGSSIRSSQINPIYYSDVVSTFLHEESRSRIVFIAKEVEFKFPNSDNGVQFFNFKEESGQLVGIMGGSGVGKSTLLNVLNGNYKPQKGQILINGYDIHQDEEQLEGVVGFVPQDDLLIEELSVYQNLYYNAQLCFRDFSETEIEHLVKRVLNDLDLYEIKDLTVGNPLNKFISGGQRKRLNIALELIREPSILFVDEPTSGLSSMDSEMVMDLLKEQTLKGRLVIVNIHQPSSDIFKLFDKLLIMDKGGHIVYNGNPVDAVTYFKSMSHHVNPEESQCLCCGNVNPEQILQILEAKVVNEFGKLTDTRKKSPKQWYKLYKKNIESKQEIEVKKEELPENYFKVPNRFKQFRIFSLRNILAKLSNRQYLMVTFLEAPLLAIILGYFTKYISGIAGDPSAYIFSQNENIPAYLFMCAVVAMFLGLTVSAEEIIRDRKILKRESFLNLSKLSYLNSKALILFIISAIQTITFILIGNFILEIRGMTWEYWLILFSTACCANMLGLNISAGLDSVVTIYILIPLLLVPQLLLSGVIVKFDKLHRDVASPLYVPFVGDLMPLRWSYEALAVTQFKHNEYQKHFFDIEKRKSHAGFAKNYLIAEIEAIVNTSLFYKQNNEKIERTKKDLKILSNELKKLQKQVPEIESGIEANITYESYDKETVKKIREYLNKLKDYYNSEFDKATSQKDRRYNNLLEKYDKEAIIELRQNYYNENLANLLRNKQDLNKVIRSKNRLVQIAEPIYKDPESKFGRAHFYAPNKQLGNTKIDTFWFNVGVIWFMSLLMYIALIFDLLRKAINASAKIRIGKRRR